jgi:hypothetical protein
LKDHGLPSAFSWHVLISFELFGRHHGHRATVGLPDIRCLWMLLPMFLE